MPEPASKPTAAGIDREDARKGEKESLPSAEPDAAGEELPNRAPLAAVDPEKYASLAAHGQVGRVDRSRADVAAAIRDAQHPFPAARAVEHELACEVEPVRLLGPEVVRHHPHHRVDVRHADALELHEPR